MKYTTGTVGKIITIRFENGDPIYKGIEKIALNENIDSGVVWIIGGVKNGGVIVGPSDSITMPPLPQIERFNDAREIVGIGTLFLDATKKPVLHLHASIGKGTNPITGCPRESLDCWLVTEAIIMEMKGIGAQRLSDIKSGFSLLEITEDK